MLKVAVISDTHLGFAYGTERQEDSFINFEQAFNNAVREQPQAILLGGDIFHDRIPKQEILGAVNPYIRLKMWPELLLLYLSAEEGDPGDIQIHQSLALVYQNLGLNDKALEELKIIDALQKKQ